MEDIDRFLPDLRTYAPQCPDVTAHRFIRQAARKFCARTKVWREWDTITIATPDEECITTISDAAIVGIESARLDGNDLEPITTNDLDVKHPGWSEDTTIGTARYITQLVPNKIALYPRATGSLRARLILQPSLAALSLPDFLLHENGPLIGKGAAAGALMVPGQPYSDAGRGRDLNADFSGEVNSLVRSLAKGQQRAPLRTKPVFF